MPRSGGRSEHAMIIDCSNGGRGKVSQTNMVTNCQIVGLGASAGGLGALKSFLDKASADMGAAFVIIQHLDPKHESLTAEILGRHTTMPAKQIERGMNVEKNHVYVIPPNPYVTLKGSKFELGEAAPRHSLARTPADFFNTIDPMAAVSHISLSVRNLSTIASR